MRRLLLLLALIAGLGVAGCGEDEESGGGERAGDARELIRRALNAPLPSGRLALDADVQIDGPDDDAESLALEVSGPFVSSGGDRLPRVDFDVSFSGGGQSLRGGVVVTENNAFVSFLGETYEIGEELVGEFNRQSEEAAEGRTTLEDFGVDAGRWLREPEVAGEEEVSGTDTTKVSGEVDANRVLADFVKLDQEYGTLVGQEPLDIDEDDRERLASAIEESRVDLFVADDGSLRRLVLDLEFQVPEELRERAEGIEGGSAKVALTFSEVGEDQDIEAPEDARPIDELLGRFGLGPESFQ